MLWAWQGRTIYQPYSWLWEGSCSSLVVMKCESCLELYFFLWTAAGKQICFQADGKTARSLKKKTLNNASAILSNSSSCFQNDNYEIFQKCQWPKSKQWFCILKNIIAEKLCNRKFCIQYRYHKIPLQRTSTKQKKSNRRYIIFFSMQTYIDPFHIQLLFNPDRNCPQFVLLPKQSYESWPL